MDSKVALSVCKEQAGEDSFKENAKRGEGKKGMAGRGLAGSPVFFTQGGKALVVLFLACAQRV